MPADPNRVKLVAKRIADCTNDELKQVCNGIDPNEMRPFPAVVMGVPRATVINMAREHFAQRRAAGLAGLGDASKTSILDSVRAMTDEQLRQFVNFPPQGLPPGVFDAAVAELRSRQSAAQAGNQIGKKVLIGIVVVGGLWWLSRRGA